jgi:steroid 5-alpha reductase family enzyme
MEILKNRKLALIFVLFIYLIAFVAGLLTFQKLYGSGILYATLAADITATLVVWIFGVITKNSSLYDPYWSIAPMIIIPGWIFLKGSPVTAVDILFALSVLFWGTRLTYNWASGWSGMQQQDWRYTMFKERTRHLWFIVNLFGINLMPTILVFLAMIPAYYGIVEKGQAGVISILGFILCITAAFIQHYADKQMKLFRKGTNSEGQCIYEGLWKYSRHPNYFGEVSFWFGIWLIQLGAVSALWKTIIGPIMMALLFIFISIPMMEKHVLVSRPGYAQYKENVSMLLPWFRKDKRKEEVI